MHCFQGQRLIRLALWQTQTHLGPVSTSVTPLRTAGKGGCAVSMAVAVSVWSQWSRAVAMMTEKFLWERAL